MSPRTRLPPQGRTRTGHSPSLSRIADDEMRLGLAPAIIVEVLDALVERARRENLGLLIVDQNVRLLSRACDTISILRSGRVIHAGSDEELIQSSYFGSAR